MRKKFNKSKSKSSKSNNFRGKSRNFKSKGSDKSTDSAKTTAMSKYEENDATWYTGDSTLTFDAGRFNWYYPNGTLIDGVLPRKFSIPGVLAMYLCPGVGVSLDRTSAVNVAARKQYTWIRRSKSSYATYDPSDLMQYEIAMSQAYQFYNWMCRLYGLLNLYSQINRYLPDALLSANLVDYNDLRSNMSDFLFYINKFGSQIGSLAAPATLPYFKRQAWLYSSVYTDDHTGKSTIFMNCPAGFYVYDETNAQLVWTPLSTTTANFPGLNGIISLGDSIVNAILGSQDFWNISADILNAYGNDILTVSPLPVDYLVVPTFDLEVLSQIQNTWITGSVSVTQHANDITQDTDGQLVYNPRIPLTNQPSSVVNLMNKPNVLVNMYKDEVTPNDVFVATRLLPSFYTSGSTAYISSCGTEICTGARVYTYFDTSSSGPSLTFQSFSRFVNFGNYSQSPVFNSSNGGLVSKLSQISYHPHVYIYSLTNVDANPTLDLIYPVGDVANYTIMNPTDLSKIHLASLFSLFNVPTLGGFNS